MKKYIKASNSKADEYPYTHKYVFKYGDGSAAASRGEEFERMCTSIGYLPDDRWATLAGFRINSLDDEFNLDDVVEAFDEYDGSTPEELWRMTQEDADNLWFDLDITGGDPQVYEILKDGKQIYYDEDAYTSVYTRSEEAWDNGDHIDLIED